MPADDSVQETSNEDDGGLPSPHRRGVALAGGAAALVILTLGVVGTRSIDCPLPASEGVGREMDLSSFSSDPPGCPLRLLFIHHSCGGQWLAPAGTDVGENCIYDSAANGGGLRDRLVEMGYEVHEASYGSQLGSATDIFDWPEKFENHLELMLRCDRQDSFYEDDRRNDIVMFKSCFPNSVFVGTGTSPGDAAGPELTVANAQAAYRRLRPVFEKHPEILFVAVTAPPVACPSQPRWKVAVKRLLGRPDLAASGRYARIFNDWLKDPNQGWLSGYAGNNVVVFDLYDVLTDSGASDFSRYPSGPGRDDSHPSREGNSKATETFVPFLNQAVHRTALCDR